MAKKKGMNMALKISLIVVGIILVLFIIYYLGRSFISEHAVSAGCGEHSDKIPMYGCSDYLSYLSDRSRVTLGADEQLASSIVGDQARGNATNESLKKGWYYIGVGDPSSAMRQFNQAWLLSPDNFNVYWGFAATLGNEDKFAESLKFFDKALELYNETELIAEGDRSRLLCDAAMGYANDFGDEHEQGDKESNANKSVQLVKEALAAGNGSARCYFISAVAYYDLKDYNSSRYNLNKAINIDPEIANDLQTIKFTKELEERTSKPAD